MLLTEGFMRRLFGVFERHKTSVDVVATSEVSVSVTIDDASRLEALMVDLREHGDVTVERNRGIVVRRRHRSERRRQGDGVRAHGDRRHSGPHALAQRERAST